MGEDEHVPFGGRLPDEVIAIIVSKMDAPTLLEYSIAYPNGDIFPKTNSSVSISIPASEFSPDMSSWWLTKSVNYLLLRAYKLWPAYRKYTPWFITRFVYMVLLAVFYIFNTPQVSDKVTKCLPRFSGIKILDVEVPLLPYADRVARSNTWFRWDAKLNVHGILDHFVYVFGDLVQPVDNEDENKEVPDGLDLFAFLKFAAQHTMLHLSMSLLQDSTSPLETGVVNVRTRDVGRTGGMLIGTYHDSTPGQFSVKASELHTTTLVSSSGTGTGTSTDDTTRTSDSLVRLRNLTLMFGASELDDGHDHKKKADDELVMACIGKSDEVGETIEKTELRRVVKHMLAHPDRIDF